MATCAKCGGTFDESTGPCPTCLAATAQPPQAPPAAPPAKSSSTKVIVVVVLAVLGVLLLFCLGIIAAVAIPNFLSAKNRAEQKRAMSEVKALATGVIAFQVDYDALPDTRGEVVPCSEMERYFDEVSQSKSGVPSDFFEFYIGPTPPTGYADGTPYYFAANGQHFLVIAVGKDRLCDPELDAAVGAWMVEWPEEGQPVEPRTTSCYEQDIVWGDYEFLWVPDDRQSVCGDQGGHPPPPYFGEPN